jgi:hypothetical protein
MRLSFEDVSRWIPDPIDFVSLGDYLGNREVYGEVFPETERSLLIEQAVLRERMRAGDLEVRREGQKFTIPAEVRKLAKNEREAILVVLDGIFPEGVCIFEEDAVAICLSGQIKNADGFLKANSKILACQVSLDFGLTWKQRLDVFYDEILVFPTAVDLSVTLSISCKNGFSILGKKEAKIEVKGGRVGVVIDARGRPVIFPSPDKIGRERVKKWRGALQ